MAAARSRNPVPSAALAEVISLLSVKYGRLPKEAILLHTHAVPALLELGIENLANLDTSRLKELIRWEMEAIYAGLAPQTNLGSLMVGLGYITEEERDMLVDKLKRENIDQKRKDRFGRIAIREGCIDHQQLEDCLRLQDQMQAQEQHIHCGFNHPNTSGRGPWLAAAISGAIHAQWVRAFGALFGNAPLKKIRLKAFYPSIGASAYFVPGIENNEEVYLLELHRASLALMAFASNAMIQCHILECSGKTPELNDLETLIGRAHLPAGRKKIYAILTDSRRRGLLDAMSGMPDIEIKMLTEAVPPMASPPDGVTAAEALMLLGAVQNHIHPGNGLAVAIQGEAPPPPLYKRPEAQAAAVLLGIAGLIAGIEGAFALRINKLEAELAKAKEETSRQEAVKNDMQVAKSKQTQLDGLKREQEQLAASKQLIESVLLNRQQFTRVLLDIVSRNLNDHVLINSIEETDWNKFVIDGWALDQLSVDHYSQGLSRDLQAWDMFISDNPSVLGRSAAGFDGYNFKLVIEKTRPNPAATAAN